MKKVMIPVLCLAVILLTGVTVTMLKARDKTEPEIMIDESKLAAYHANITKKELLQGVTAIDDKDGDVTESLIVESVKTSEDGKEVSVTYVASDQQKNVTKKVWTYGREEAVTDEVQKDSTEEVTDETQELGTVEEDPEDALKSLAPEIPRFYLKEYEVTLSVGASFRKLEWVKDITDDKDDRSSLYSDIRVDGEVDVQTPGTYELTYYVIDSDGNRSNDAVLVVTVEG